MTTATIAGRSQRQASRALTGFAWGVLGFMVLVALWGAVVRATGSGAGCGKNWPLCNGMVWPLHHPLLTTIVEFTHRSMSGICTFLVIALAVWTFKGTPRGHLARKAATASGLLLLMEALLGAALVLGGWVEKNTSAMRVVMQAIHFTNTLLLLGALTLTAWFLGRDRRGVAPVRDGRLLAWLAVWATILVGAMGALAALADTIFPTTDLMTGLREDFAASSPTLVRMRWLHPAATVVATVFVVLLAMRLTARYRAILLGTIALQFALGGLDVLLLAPTWLQVVHLLGADLYWIALVAFSADAVWPEKIEADPLRR
ncbi:cytochrome c oxidase assembly protein subunit 15 [Granulicella rosea]|uniref:Cytochrome c oxidase assembly protein subunit 15 n=1 Tax=Granulicella rosea TaxID=474952 RepID=A0A239H781_9BACT|nr:COX15/CtaA family protein [Granulicella rosea]SNS77005.1 cytochrome c oxidase assembly protein subunit 15 [Granulicella rosea]